MLAKVQELAAALAGIAEQANVAKAATVELSSLAPVLDAHRAKIADLQAGAANLEGTLARLRSSSSAASGDVETHLGSMVTAATAAEASVAAASSSMARSASNASQSVPRALAEVARAAEETQGQVTTRLDDLQNAVADHSNLWNKAVSELIDAVKIGAIPVQELITLYGDAQIGGQRLSEYLKGLDLSFYRDQVREMVQGLNEGSVEIARVQQFLGQTQLVFAKQLSDVIDLFRQGSVTLKRVEEIVRQVQKAFPDSELSDLADALYQALKR